MRAWWAIGVAGLAVLPQARAQPAQEGGLPSVYVTAQRRAEPLQEVPFNVSVLGGEALGLLGASGRDLRYLAARMPSLHIESDFGRSFPRFYLRGLGNTDFDLNAAQPVGVVYDEVVQESPLLKSFPLFDLQQVEVLRGPQGSLFGRNAPAGVVKFDAVRPAFRREGYLNTGIGKDRMRNADGAFNTALGETLALRVSLLSQHRANRVFNDRPNAATTEFEGYHDNAARVQLLYQPGPAFSALLNGHARRMGGRATLFRANIMQKGSNALVPGFDYASLPTDGINHQHLKTGGASLRLRWQFDGLSLHAISGWERARFYSRADVDAGYGSLSHLPMGPGRIPFPSETADALPRHRQLTQEVRLESDPAREWSWLAGVYGFSEKIRIDSFGFDTFNGNSQNAYAWQEQDSRSLAAFGALAWRARPGLLLRAGLRYTKDRKDFFAARPQPAPGAQPIAGLAAAPRGNDLSWDLGATQALSPDSHVYARVATGYRAPSIQGRILFGNSISVARAEQAVSWEAGWKQDFMQHRARLGLALFRYTVADMQLTAGSGVVNQNRLVNAAKVRGQGIEVEGLVRPNSEWTASVGASYNATRIRDAGLFVLPCGNGCTVLDPRGTAPNNVFIDGNPLPRSPRWIANATLRYSRPWRSGALFAATDWAYRGQYNFFLYEAVEYKARPLLDGGLRLGYKDGRERFEVAAFVRNVTNKVVAVAAIDFNNFTGVVNEPRSYGIQLKFNY
ncbi:MULTISPECIES: TonB-dependent receptor [unclassified Duganella]|uniref:TonB-dependent receptor n=1 Tax=unclassified Duganella TaxID=2636909 RepID=UPI000700CE55|nr:MULTISPECIES: TonB-dependent receptor [unclassified Duganella]KQV54369.1 TonB-dependent receptor [Duganella sp. Root336D2]KRC03496.1 TonB-dependent receptor [Duganella sp. Root198D2]